MSAPFTQSLLLTGSLLSSLPGARTLRALASLLLSSEAPAIRVPEPWEPEGGKGTLPPPPCQPHFSPPTPTRPFPALLPLQLLAPSGQLLHLELHWARLLCHCGELEGSIPSVESVLHPDQL